jgi:predicted transcriptional regulator
MTMQELIDKSVKENLDRAGLKPMTPKNVRWVFSEEACKPMKDSGVGRYMTAEVSFGPNSHSATVKPSTEQDLHVSSLAKQEAKLDKIKSALLMIISEHQSITIWNRSLADSISSLREALEEL